MRPERSASPDSHRRRTPARVYSVVMGPFKTGRNGWWSCGLLVVLAAGAAAPAQPEASGTQVQQAVRRGVQAIRNLQHPDGSWPERSQPGGNTALALLALLQADVAPGDPAVVRGLEHLRTLPNRHVYTVSLKLMALALADPQRFRPDLEEGARFLIAAQNRSGLWSYTVDGGERFDHSNSQFALLGLQAAADAGIHVPLVVWRRALATVVRTQRPDGGWSYQEGGASYGSMTAAGVADLLILGHAIQQRERSRGCGNYRTSAPLARGMAWLAEHFRSDTNPIAGGQHLYYWLYAVERCGILAGQRYLGRHDWYRLGASFLVRAQDRDGRWRGDLTDTCFAVLFLTKGYRALLVQKLQWSDVPDAWSPTRFDLAGLVVFLGQDLGQPVTWQTVRFEAPLEDWLAAPLLFVHGSRFPSWDADRRAKLRAYVENGGTVLFEAADGAPAFREGFERFVAETFPEVPLRRIGAEHAVYRLLYPLVLFGDQDGALELFGLDYGCRTSILFSPHDLACPWERSDVPGPSERPLQLGANIAAYATGRRPLRDRLDAVVLPSDSAAATAGPPALDALRLTQLVHEGDWRPFPTALVRLAEFLRDAAGVDVVTQYRQLRATAPELVSSPILVLAGHGALRLSPEEQTALRTHLQRGGFLLADACCGTEPFATDLRALLGAMFPDSTLERLPPDHPIYTGTPGFDVRQVSYSEDVVRAKGDLRAPELWGLRSAGRLVVVFSPYSLSCGLSGPAFDGCWGYASEDALRLTSNIVLYALTR